MTITAIEQDFKAKVCEKIRLFGEGVDHFLCLPLFCSKMATI